MTNRNTSAFLCGLSCAVTPDILERSIEREVAGQLSFADTPRVTALLRAGNEAAFRWLHGQWNERLFRYCLVLARGDGTAASDIAQSTYVRLCRHVRELPNEQALWNWMACAARSAATDLHRTRGRYRAALERFGDWLRGSVDGSRDFECAEEDGDALFLALEIALSHLEREERFLVDARYFQALALEDIARKIGVSARAVEGRLARLRKRLRTYISAELARKISKP